MECRAPDHESVLVTIEGVNDCLSIGDLDFTADGLRTYLIALQVMSNDVQHAHP